jgi:MFS family permease
VLLILAGRLGDLPSQRNVFLLGLVIFTVAPVVCALAQNLGEIIASRVVGSV